MNILFLCHFFPPSHTSGAENYTFHLAQALVQLGHPVHVLCAGTWDIGEHYWNGHADEIYAGIHVRRLQLCWHEAPDPNRYLYDNPVTAEHLRGWLKEIQPDIVHVTSCYTLSASVIQVCKDAQVPVVVTLVDFWFLCPSLHLLRSDDELCDGHTTPWQCLQCMTRGSRAYRWSARLLSDRVVQPVLTAASRNAAISRRRGLRGMALNMADRKQVVARYLQQADVILAPSRFLAAVHTAIVQGLPIQVQPYGHDLSWLADFQGRTPDDILHFCYMGQIAHEKGVHILIEAFLSLDPAPGIALDIWGNLDNSPYAARIQELVMRSGSIHLRGRFPRSQLAAVLAQADVVVVPSIWYENNPLVIQEAFAAGVPVIATDLGGMTEFVQHNMNGLLFERGNAHELARQMRRILHDHALLPRLRAGIPPVKTIEQEIDEILAVYRQLQRQQPHV